MKRGFPLHDFQVIGPFDLVGLYDEDGRFTQAACSCGWHWDGFEDEMREACKLHNMTHVNVLKIQKLYQEQELDYDTCLNFLVMVSDLNEGHACELLDSWKIAA